MDVDNLADVEDPARRVSLNLQLSLFISITAKALYHDTFRWMIRTMAFMILVFC